MILGAAAALDVARRVEEAAATVVKEEGGEEEEEKKEKETPLLTFHAASSMSNTIRYADLFKEFVIPFWDDHMPPRRFRASKKYKSIHSWSSFVPQKSLAYDWMRVVGNLKFGSLAVLLRVMGQGKAAEALWRGWSYLQLYNDEKLDFGLFFCVRNVEAVEELMVEAMAAGSPGAEAYRRRATGAVGGGGGCCSSSATATVATANEIAAAPRSALVGLLPAGSMTATGDAVVGAAAAAAAAAASGVAAASGAAAASTSTTTTSTSLPAPLTWRGDWGPYMRRYSEVIHAKFFGPDGALNGAGGMKKGKEEKRKAKKAEAKKKKSSSIAFSPSSVSASSTTTPRRARAMAGAALVNRRVKGGEGEGTLEAAGAKPAAVVHSAPTTPARPLVAPPQSPALPPSSPSPSSPSSSSPLSSSPPSTPPSEPLSPCSVFVVGAAKKQDGSSSSSPTRAGLHSSASSSPAAPRLPTSFSLVGCAAKTAAAAEVAKKKSNSTSSSSSSSSSLAGPSTEIVHSDSVKDLSEYTSAAVDAEV